MVALVSDGQNSGLDDDSWIDIVVSISPRTHDEGVSATFVEGKCQGTMVGCW